MNKYDNCSYCQEHCQCDWECRKCEPIEEEIIEEEFEDKEPGHVCCSECSCWDNQPEEEPIEEEYLSEIEINEYD